MRTDYLSKVGSDLVKRCGTRDPFRIAHELGIEVLFCDDFGPLKPEVSGHLEYSDDSGHGGT